MATFNEENLKYMNGFGNEFQSEAEGFEGTIPENVINILRCKNNMFVEQLSGSAFTAPRANNKRSWLYRKLPSTCHQPLKLFYSKSLNFKDGVSDPTQRRWKPFECDFENSSKVDFVDGLHTLAYSDPTGCSASSVSIMIYIANTSMMNKSFVNCDGDFLIVPQLGTLYITTEFGKLLVKPNEIVVIQQGMKFNIATKDPVLRGYILEVKGNHFELPYLGPIGANGLANPRDFQVPVASVETIDTNKAHQVIHKFQNQLFSSKQNHSPYDVAAWFGNYVPYKYNLDKFVSVNSVSVDHPDPSIFTVLTCPSIGKYGTALADFVIFPPRWECAENTFRPPYYHRNTMTEFMGLIKGQYQAKSKKFAPGGASLHQSMIPHGPDAECYEMAINQNTGEPRKVAEGTMAFMFETCFSLKLSHWAISENVDQDYYKCWEGLANLKLETDFIGENYNHLMKN